MKPSLRVLCVDDDMAHGDRLIRLFSTAGHAVEHLADGLDAWDKLSRDIEYFDVVITENHLPGLNGLGVVEVLRAANYRGRIVVHSGSVTLEETVDYRAQRVDAMVTKCGIDVELLRTVEALPPRERGAASGGE
ncbi:MAG: response regulator [Opitutaceae bacterium]|nr:response regulator [Opitutaceae bacterium]